MMKELKKKSKRQEFKKNTGTNAILVLKKKAEWGPMMDAIVKTGIDVIVPSQEKGYKNVIQFGNDEKMVKRVPGVKYGWWMCDYRKLEGKPDVDYVFLCNKEYMEEYSYVAPTYYIPQHGMDKPVTKKIKIKWDAIFIGNFTSTCHQNRGDILSYIGKHVDLKIYSAGGFTVASPWLYSQTMFSLAISPQGKSYTSNRLYNILAAGGFCLTLWFPGIEYLFTNHKHLVWFKTKEEAVDIMEYYYNRPEERKKIREAGHKLYLEKHTAECRLTEMFNIMG